MKKLLIGLALLISLPSFAECEKSIKATNLFSLIEQYEVALSDLGFEEIEEAKNDIQNNEFCATGSGIDSTIAHLNSLGLCTMLAVEANLFAGGENMIKAKNEEDQRELERALLEFGMLFKSSEETQGFSCDLKTMYFPTLGS